MILHAHERGEGAPVALLHGLYGQSSNFASVQRRLASHRRVIALDLRNHGASPHAPGMDYPAMAQDVMETLRVLDALPCALIGHSMGGKVAMMAALTAPAEVVRLLIADIAPTAYAHGASHAAYLAAMRGLALPPGLTRAAADAALADAVPEAGVRGFLLQNLRIGEAPSWRLNLAAIEASLPALLGWPAPGRVRYAGPTLFVAGGRSDYIAGDQRTPIRALFPQARFTTLKDAGHWLHADDPDGFVAVTEAFLDAA